MVKGRRLLLVVVPHPLPGPSPAHPISFANGRYSVKRFLGEGGKKKVCLAHDEFLDRDVAFAAAALLGDPEKARAHYQRAPDVCSKTRFCPEMALNRLQLAELLLENYPDERAEALEHLDFAIAELRDMRMQPALERVLRHRDI